MALLGLSREAELEGLTWVLGLSVFLDVLGFIKGNSITEQLEENNIHHES